MADNPTMGGGRSGGGGPGGFDVSWSQIPLIGNFFPNKAEEHKLKAMYEAGEQYQQYRPEFAAAATNATGQALSKFAPVNNAIAAMYGSQYTTDLTVQNPFGAGAFDAGWVSPPPARDGWINGLYNWSQEGAPAKSFGGARNRSQPNPYSSGVEARAKGR